MERLARDWRRGLSAGARWLVSPGGSLETSFEFFFALAGPIVDRELRRYLQTSAGPRRLRERSDLNAMLYDREALAALPVGSFGRAYLDYIDGFETESAEKFTEAAQIERIGQRLGWGGDHTWFMRRMTNSHDLFHVLAGYGTDIVGEVGVVGFTFGQVPFLPLAMMTAYMHVLKPSAPREWIRFVRESVRYGRGAERLTLLDYESLLPEPLDAVRSRVGLGGLGSAHPRGMPEPGLILDVIHRHVIYEQEKDQAAAAATL